MTKVLILAALMAIVAGGSQAQTGKRIQFAKGKSSVNLKGTTGTNGTTYIVRARSGQKLILDLSPSTDLGIKVETDGRWGQHILLREERGGRYEIGLQDSGDYTIFVGSLDHKPRSFSLTVTIGRLADI